MASEILVNIKEEVTCPICLELLTQPLSLDCGHSFCQTCITADSKESMISQGESSCPVCRISYQPENLRPNRHVANIVETLREVKLIPEEEQNFDLCVLHGEKLLLFCKEDGKFICWLCERSQKHRGHHTFLMEEIAPEYREKLQEALDRLRAEQQEAEKVGADIREERTSWKNLIENECQNVQDGFEKLRGILDCEEQKELQKLQKEEEDVVYNLDQAESVVVKQSKLLRELISDLDRRLQGSAVEMLQDVNDIMERSKNFTLTKPKTPSKEKRSVFQAPNLSAIMQKFNGLTDARHYWVPVTLVRPTNASNVDISANLSQVRCVLNPSRGYVYQGYVNKDYGVLGSPPITSGKHYWEVDVSAKNAWVLGVCSGKGTDFDKANYVYDCKYVYGKYQPKYGYWVIVLENQHEYKAFEDSPSNVPLTKLLKLTVSPCCVGIFLDYDARTVSFLNATDHGCLIYKFSSCSFSKVIFPFFNPMECPAPMKLCSSVC